MTSCYQLQGLLGGVVALDERLTLLSAICASPQTPLLRVLQVACYTLELSGHGVIWFGVVGVLGMVYLWTGDPLLWVYAFNLLTILIMDIVLVAPLKLIFRRSRPKLNRGTIPMSISTVDAYAFPSGHASRCVALAAFFCYMPPFYLRTHLWYMWAVVMSLSRILLGRHHISDVLAGMAAGLVVFEVVRRTVLLLPTLQ